MLYRQAGYPTKAGYLSYMGSPTSSCRPQKRRFLEYNDIRPSRRFQKLAKVEFLEGYSFRIID